MNIEKTSSTIARSERPLVLKTRPEDLSQALAEARAVTAVAFKVMNLGSYQMPARMEESEKTYERVHREQYDRVFLELDETNPSGEDRSWQGSGIGNRDRAGERGDAGLFDNDGVGEFLVGVNWHREEEEESRLCTCEKSECLYRLENSCIRVFTLFFLSYGLDASMSISNFHFA